MPTHGSLTKAGKVRSATPKIQAKPRQGTIPKINNLRKYEKRIILGRKPGQNWMNERSGGYGGRR
ncbi:MAG TPA: 30S ribosomal protein S30e [Candidatus Bathyarchaeia archaeon]|nr:30S ribosomal protein S30e [Candidatus Bathyarchaeia archaeon]